MLFEVENDTDILEECVRPTLWITRGKLFNNLGYLTFITVVFVIWTRKRPLISLRSFNTRSIPSSAASRTFCGKNRSRARARNRNDRVDLGSRLRHDRALDGRVLDSIVPVIADGIRSLLQRVQSFQGRVNGRALNNSIQSNSELRIELNYAY